MSTKATMPRISTQPISGPAILKKAKLRDGTIVWIINMRTWDTKARDYVQVDEFRVEVGQAPSYLKPGDWNLRVASDKSKILSGIPDSAVLVCEFYDIPHAENQPPAPSIKASSFDPKKPWVQFSLRYKVVEGELEGVIITDFLNYNFGGMDYKGHMVTAYKPATGKSTEALAQRIDALGILEFGQIPWKGDVVMWASTPTDYVNILPLLEARARKAVEELGTKIQVSIVGGKVVQVKSLVEDTLWEGDDNLPEVDDIPAAAPETTDTPVSETVPASDDIDWDDVE